MKKNLNFLSKRGIICLLIMTLIIAYFAPIIPVFAVSSTTSLTVTFRGDSANYGKVQYSLNDGAYWNDISEDTNNLNIAVTGENLMLRLVPQMGCSVDYAGIELNLDGNSNVITSEYGFESQDGYIVASDVQSVTLSQVEFRDEEGHNNQGQENEPNNQNKEGKYTLYVTGEEFEYHEGSEEACDFQFGINSPNLNGLTSQEVNFTKENGKIIGLETKEAKNIVYNSNNNGKVTFYVRTQWNDVITTLTINGQEFSTPRTKEELTNAFSKDFRAIVFIVEDVPEAEIYNIEIHGRKQTENETIMGNFGWNYDQNSNVQEDDKIPHGNIEFVEAKYNGVTYQNKEDWNAAGEVYQWKDAIKKSSYNQNDRDAFGEAMFPVGVELTVKLIPDSGYQLTEFTLNGTPFEPGEEVGVYTFTTIGGNFHLGAHFTEVNNEVETDSKKVKSGNIEIKTNNDAFSNGTAKLEINDIENLPEDRTSAFTETASNEGYRIDDYLDMSLYNTIYKGGLKDVSGRYESWDTSIEKIDDDASITLELEENMEGKDIVVLHEIHDGDTVTGYEILDAKYDKENNAITFETDSFSNYAIASRESTAKTYTVTLEKNNGEEAEKCNVNENEKIEEPKEPSKEGFKFEGWYKDKELTERFDFEDEIKEDITLYAKWIEDQSKEMELKSGTYIAIFKENPEHKFELTFIDVLTLDSEQLEELGVKKEEFDQILKLIKDNTSKYGTVLSVYAIEIKCDEYGYTGETQIKIKMTDEMKKFNSFKMIYIDDENNFKAGDVVNLTVEGEYLVGTLPHLSAYALVGESVQKESTVEEKTEVKPSTDTEKKIETKQENVVKTNNPKTGDEGLAVWIELMVASILGIIGTVRILRRRK